MPRRNEENDFELASTDSGTETSRVAVEEKKPVSKIQAKVYKIVKNQIFLKDGNGNEYRLHTSKANKNVKIGDSINL